MALLEERPTKIRKLDSGLGGDQVAEFASNTHDESLKASTVGRSANQALNVSSSFPNEYTAASVSLIDDTKLAQPLSKNQLKKLRRKKEWEDGREYRKAKRREKIKAKKIRKAESRAIADRQATEDVPLSPYSSQRRNGQRPAQLPVTIILDCDFDELMTESEIISLGSQLTRCYSDNKTALYRAHLVISSFSGKLKHRFETVLASNHLGWKGVKFTADDFFAAAKEADSVMGGPQGGRLLGAFAGGKDTIRSLQQSSSLAATEEPSSAVVSGGSHSASMTATEIASSEIEQVSADDKVAISAVPPFSTDTLVTDKPSNKLDGALLENIGAKANDQPMNLSREPNIVYLTSDSPHTLDALSPYTTYIIGGLVDKNRHKGICYKRAMARNIPTAKLPIGEYMTMQSRSVLATNHVAEIMIKWLECGDWAEAFLQVIPKRKEAKLKAGQTKGNGSQNEDDGNGSSSSQEE